MTVIKQWTGTSYIIKVEESYSTMWLSEKDVDELQQGLMQIKAKIAQERREHGMSELPSEN